MTIIDTSAWVESRGTPGAQSATTSTSSLSPADLPPLGKLLRLGLSGGIVLGTAFGPAFAIAIGPDRARVAPLSPSQIHVDSALIGFIGGLGVGTVIMLALTFLVEPGTIEAAGVGAAASLVAALVLGAGTVAFHCGYRFVLSRRGDAPLRWVLFLDWVCDHLYLRPSGAAYEFVHIELRDHLATASGGDHGSGLQRG